MHKLLIATVFVGLVLASLINTSDAGIGPSSKKSDAYFRPSILDYHLFRVNAQRFSQTGHQHYIPNKRNRGRYSFSKCPQCRSNNCKCQRGQLTDERHNYKVGSSDDAVYPSWRGYRHSIHPHFTHDHPKYLNDPHVDYNVYRYTPIPPRQFFGESSYDDKPEFLTP